MRLDRFRIWWRRVRRVGVGAATSCLIAIACGDADSGPRDLSSVGARVYRANCAVCHNPDPALDGSVGPAVAGSSRELLEARILRASYPAGYTPKKNSALMPAMPYLEGDIEALSAFLSGAGAPSSDEAGSAAN